jgi:hypothetical protein
MHHHRELRRHIDEVLGADVVTTTRLKVYFESRSSPGIGLTSRTRRAACAHTLKVSFEHSRPPVDVAHVLRAPRQGYMQTVPRLTSGLPVGCW